jgi:long-chain acyl-CoA synthetase
VPDVDVPAPPQLVPALLDRLRRRGDSPPLAVIDPTWSTRLREQAMADLADAVAARRLTDGDLVLFTSGSSGSPRAVVRTLQSWRASLEPLRDLTGIGSTDGGNDLVWVPGPVTSSLFLYGALHAAWLGLPWAGGRHDGAPVQRATSAHLVPTQLADTVDARGQGLLPRLHTVVVAGAHLPASLRRRAERAGLRVVEYCGAAELSFVGWRDDDGPFRDFPGAQVRIENDRTLWVRSPYVARAGLRPDGEGSWRQRGDWHTVGDLGLVEDGGWRLVGRGSSVVTTGGHTIVVGEVEAALRQVPGVRDVVVVGLPHPRLAQVVVAVVVPDGSSDDDLRRRLEHAARGLPAPARPRRWLRADTLPLLASGKVDRATLLDAISARTLPPL